MSRARSPRDRTGGHADGHADGHANGHANSGFSLLEVLIALLVLAVGALAIGRFASLQARQADAARHRTEAALLAQAKLDELRSGGDLNGVAGTPTAAASDADQPAVASNTRFARSWQLSGAPTDAQRQIEVRVDWTDRDGRSDEAGVNLRALVARADPAGAARLALGQGVAGAALQQPFGRSAAIPWQARRLDGANRGLSALPWGAAGAPIVFDDVSSAVLAQCDTALDDRTDVAAACRPIDALLLSGFLSGADAAAATGIGFEQLQHSVAAPVCRIEPAAAPDGRAIAGLRAYRCLLRPGDHDGDAGTPRVWSGRTVVLPQPAGTQSVCRYTVDAAPGGGTPRNDDHPALYTLVSRTLQHQNFALVARGACPDGSVPHQPQ